MRKLTMIALAASLTLGLALPALAQTDTQLTAGERERLDTSLEDLQDIITRLAYEDDLNRSETDTLRRQLAELYRELSALRGRVGGYPPSDDDGRAGVWTRFGQAVLRLSPQTARFSGWQAGNSLRVSYGDAGVIFLTVENGPYTARWTLRDAYSGSVNTTVRAETGGDVRLSVSDNRGSHEFLIKDGGLGPIYMRNISGTGFGGGPDHSYIPGTVDGRTAGVWYRIYRDQVDRGRITQSLPMTWLIQQYQDNSFVNAKVRNLGVVLGELEGTPLSSQPIGELRYQRSGQTYELDIPDPRRNPAEFASFARVLYDLDQASSWYEFDLPGLQ